MAETAERIARDVATVGRIGAVPTLLRVLCETTGMGFAAVARVSDETWTACAVHDTVDFGLRAGGQLDLHTTLCKEAREARRPIVFDQASIDPHYCGHHTPRTYRIESYASFPIILPNGDYFGNLCAIDPRPARIDEPRVRAMFERFAELIAVQIDEERRSEETRSALSSERELSELREQFIAILGHDLRNPLGAVSAGTQLLRARATDPLTVGLLDRMSRNITRMSGLIADTLDFARGRLGGGLPLDLQRHDGVGAAIEEVVEAVRAAHPDRAVECDVRIDRPVRCDLSRVQQVASNLVGNAVAHGRPEATAKVRATLVGDDLELATWNDGEPIAPESLARIFEPFWRGGTGHVREGLGLGLHICSLIARAHGGTVTVDSTAEGGTTFAVRLPIAGPV